NNVTAIAGGSQFSLALRRDGSLTIWGNPSQSQRAIPNRLKNVAAIAAGRRHFLALVSDRPPVVFPILGPTAAYGGTVFLHATAVGARPLDYQWEFEGNDIVGATNDALALTNLLLSQAGAYSVVVSNAFGRATSPNLNLDVSWLMISSQPQDATTF